MGKRSRSRRDTSRESGQFIAIPTSVIDSAAYRGLSHTARSLLIDIARELRGSKDDPPRANGQLVATPTVLGRAGWRSPDVIHRAMHELIKARLLYRTVQGYRPMHASWYAVTWHTLDPHLGYDSHADFFRGAYQDIFCRADSEKNGIRSTSDVVAGPSIATSHVVAAALPTTPDVAICPVSAHQPTTSDVHHLRVTISSAVPQGGLNGLDPDLDGDVRVEDRARRSRNEISALHRPHRALTQLLADGTLTPTEAGHVGRLPPVEQRRIVRALKTGAARRLGEILPLNPEAKKRARRNSTKPQLPQGGPRP